MRIWVVILLNYTIEQETRFFHDISKTEKSIYLPEIDCVLSLIVPILHHRDYRACAFSMAYSIFIFAVVKVAKIIDFNEVNENLTNHKNKVILTELTIESCY